MSRPIHWLCFQPLIEHHLAGVWKETISDLDTLHFNEGRRIPGTGLDHREGALGCESIAACIQVACFLLRCLPSGV